MQRVTSSGIATTCNSPQVLPASLADVGDFNWRHPVTDYPGSGDEVHQAVKTTAGQLNLEQTVAHKERDFLLDVYVRTPPQARSVAEKPVSRDPSLRRRISHVGIVVPAHDEEVLLPACISALETAAAAIDVFVDILVVLDACTDLSSTPNSGGRHRRCRYRSRVELPAAGNQDPRIY